MANALLHSRPPSYHSQASDTHRVTMPSSSNAEQQQHQQEQDVTTSAVVHSNNSNTVIGPHVVSVSIPDHHIKNDNGSSSNKGSPVKQAANGIVSSVVRITGGSVGRSKRNNNSKRSRGEENFNNLVTIVQTSPSPRSAVTSASVTTSPPAAVIIRR